jgi:hypothetical protein
MFSRRHCQKSKVDTVELNELKIFYNYEKPFRVLWRLLEPLFLRVYVRIDSFYASQLYINYTLIDLLPFHISEHHCLIRRTHFGENPTASEIISVPCRRNLL